eukprot:scaffold1386_cov77-Cyclotella_meneghiniana.AAC.8
MATAANPTATTALPPDTPQPSLADRYVLPPRISRQTSNKTKYRPSRISVDASSSHYTPSPSAIMLIRRRIITALIGEICGA